MCSSDLTLYYLARLLRLLHPFMPFISEHFWHDLKDIAAERNMKITDADSLLGGDSIMNTVYDKPYCHQLSTDRSIALFEKVKEIVTNVRNIRTSKNISPREPLTLLVDDRHDSAFEAKSPGVSAGPRTPQSLRWARTNRWPALGPPARLGAHLMAQQCIHTPH